MQYFVGGLIIVFGIVVLIAGSQGTGAGIFGALFNTGASGSGGLFPSSGGSGGSGASPELSPGETPALPAAPDVPALPAHIYNPNAVKG